MILLGSHRTIVPICLHKNPDYHFYLHMCLTFTSFDGKDVDFVNMVSSLGAPPKLIWLTCGNVSNEALRALLGKRLHMALTVLESDDIVEIA